MVTYLLRVQYDGTDFCGWQKQPRGRSVQGEMEKAARIIFRASCAVTGAGRTDKGVHAVGQAVSVAAPSRLPSRRVLNAFNSLLPQDVSISSARIVPASFNPRYNAKEKIYRYVIWNRPYRSVWSQKYSWHIMLPLDVPAMRKGASFLHGRHDFDAFTASGCSQEDRTAEMREITVTRSSGKITITFRGNRFLYKMIRNIVGTLADAGRGFIPPEKLREILDSGDRRKAGRTAPPQGLFLQKVIF